MISERQAAKGLHALWSEVIPLLTPHFMHLFNEAYCELLEDATGTVASEVSGHEDTDATVVSELAFHLARLAHEWNTPIVENLDDAVLKLAEVEALALIQNYESPTGTTPYSVSDNERSEAIALAKNYRLFLSGYSRDLIEFHPMIPGAGFIDACVGDLSIGNSLFEIKTVKRNIAGKDMRQLLVYLALQAATGDRRWSAAGFFNPRRARVYRFYIDEAIPLISGGRLALEVFREMIEYVSVRENQLDVAF